MASFFPRLKKSFILIVAWLILCQPNITLADEQVPAKQVPTQKIELHLDGNRLTADISNVPLRDVAKTLKTKTHARILVSDPEIADEPVSVRVRSSSLEEAMQTILNGFSYALDASSQKLTAVVLSTPPQRYRGSETHVSACQGNSIDPLTHSTEVIAANPQTLDEFTPLMSNSGDCETPGKGDNDRPPSPSGEDKSQEQEAMLQRALNVLESPQKHLYADAIEQLGMLHDELANATLIKLARHSQQGPERYLATEELAIIAVQSEFKDANVMMVLEQLATDRNQDVRRSASQVVEQMHQVDAQ